MRDDDIEYMISNFMLSFSKFEFFVINQDKELAHLHLDGSGLKKVGGIDWNKLALRLESVIPFASFDFSKHGFSLFKETYPQYLVIHEDGNLKWDCDEVAITSWNIILTKGLAQLRNNIAHGNKAYLPSPFTEGRTREFIIAARALMDFIAANTFGYKTWQQTILFAN